MNGATMPKTTIYKNCDTLLRKVEIRSAEYGIPSARCVIDGGAGVHFRRTILILRKHQRQQNQEKQDAKDKSQKKEMTKEDAERILNALKDEDEIQKKIKRQGKASGYTGKDW